MTRSLALPATILVTGLRTVSGMNARENRYVRAKRVKGERQLVAFHLGASPSPLAYPVRIVMTRVAPAYLDSDNLGSALKAVQDEVAAWLGKDDGRAERAGEIEWVRAQRKAGKGAYHVEIAIEPRCAAAVMAARGVEPVPAFDGGDF